MINSVFIMLGLLFAPGLHPWGDDGKGGYVNPILPLDVSDLDAIRVGKEYYAISSTIQCSPGMLVLRSRDLVNWEMIGHVVPDITKLDPELNWDRMNQYGKGVWAGSIRYHAGRFFVYFNVPGTGFFVSTAAHPAGPWNPARNLWAVAGWDDPCPFWDDDGQAYLVASHFSDGYKIHLFRLSPDGMAIDKSSGRVIHQSRGSEANKLYKFDGTYYHLFSDVQPEGRVVEMERSASLNGPWQIRQLNHVHPAIDKEPNQGGLVEARPGHWYFVSHQGRGDWEGRAGVLLPVTWVDGWPVIGHIGADGIGEMVWSGSNPLRLATKTSLVRSDDFNSSTLAPEWEWNHQPRADKWSLSENPGFLRLHAFRPLHKGDFFSVGNVLTQRSLRSDASEVTVKLKLDGMADADEAGLAHFADTACTLGVAQNAGKRRLLFHSRGELSYGPYLHGSSVWLRSTWHYEGQSQFAYSLDGIHFVAIGLPYALTWGKFRGDRIGLFSFNQAGNGGFVDVDAFRYRVVQ